MPATLALSTGAVRTTRRTHTFPSVALPTRDGAVPIEVNLVARLGHGEGSRLFHESAVRQRHHDRFVDALDEPSAKLGGTDFSKGDATALYTFGVDHGGHPFHRHAGHRVFTAVSGSAGAQLRFSTATVDDIEQDPDAFARALRYVDVPPDCLFTVRFSGEHWHQFVPRHGGTGHPAFFALSTHTNELGGDLTESLRERVMRDEGDIPSLTELLPASLVAHLQHTPLRHDTVPVTVLSLGDRPGSLLESACLRYRATIGRLCTWRARAGVRSGFVSHVQPPRVVEHHTLPADSLLNGELNDRHVHHQDRFTLTVSASSLGLASERDAAVLLERLLDSFLVNRHEGVTRLMALRNTLVRPLQLRTSPLACPVSSLLSGSSPRLFAGRFPVHASCVDDDRRAAQVVLGADDRHLVFRSCIEVRVRTGDRIEFALSNRVACRNPFGRFYMAAISMPHRRYIVPRLLDVAVTSLGEPTAPRR